MHPPTLYKFYYRTVSKGGEFYGAEKHQLGSDITQIAIFRHPMPPRTPAPPPPLLLLLYTLPRFVVVVGGGGDDAGVNLSFLQCLLARRRRRRRPASSQLLPRRRRLDDRLPGRNGAPSDLRAEQMKCK